MPGYLVDPIANASNVSNIPAGSISSSNVQGALNELDTEKITLNDIPTFPEVSKAHATFIAGI
jgi:hypothetical protein